MELTRIWASKIFPENIPQTFLIYNILVYRFANVINMTCDFILIILLKLPCNEDYVRRARFYGSHTVTWLYRFWYWLDQFLFNTLIQDFSSNEQVRKNPHIWNRFTSLLFFPLFLFYRKWQWYWYRPMLKHLPLVPRFSERSSEEFLCSVKLISFKIFKRVKGVS